MDVVGSTDVIVVGAGISGCAIARVIAPDHDVIVLDRGVVGGGTTARAAGLVTMTPSYTDEPAVAEHATDFFRRYDGTHGFTFTERPSFELVRSTEAELARRRVSRLTEQGVPVEFCTAATMADHHPRFDPDAFAGAVRHSAVGFVAPDALVEALRTDAEADGARFLTDMAVTDVVAVDGTVRGVRVGGDAYRARHVVVAAGWRTHELLDGLLQLPVRPYRTQCVVLTPDRPLGDGFPMGAIPDERVYFRPKNGDLQVGGWASATDRPGTASRAADAGFREHASRIADRFFRGFDGAHITAAWAGVDAATPDTRPVIDHPPDAPEGLYVAVGFNGRGIMTAPVTATLVRDYITGERSSLPREPFAVERFESRTSDFALYSDIRSDGADESDSSRCPGR